MKNGIHLGHANLKRCVPEYLCGPRPRLAAVCPAQTCRGVFGFWFGKTANYRKFSVVWQDATQQIEYYARANSRVSPFVDKFLINYNLES